MIHALPGIGGDHRMFPPPWGTLPGFVAHDWPPFKGESTVAEVACRFCEQYSIEHGDVLVGASFGGMVACEVAKLRPLQSIYLVGSATTNAEISRLLRMLGPATRFSTMEWLRLAAKKFPGEVYQMFAKAEPQFIRAMCTAILNWRGLGSYPVRCFRIHGSRDLIIPPPSRTDLLLEGGHLISMTHARECVDFVRAHSVWT